MAYELVITAEDLQQPLLAPGDLIDVVAPGFRCSREQLDHGIAFLRQRGLKPRVPAELFGADLLCANTDAQRFAQLRKALYARDSRAVWCVRGGYGAIRIIERLQALKPPAKPKLLIGYSDATTLHQLLNLFWGWPSLHGPLLDRSAAAMSGMRNAPNSTPCCSAARRRRFSRI